MVASADWVLKNYRLYSQMFFGGSMPNIQVKSSSQTKTWGRAIADYHCDDRGEVYFDNFRLDITLAFDMPEDVMLNVLLHEMIHIYDFYNFPNHFGFFKNGKFVDNRKYDAHGSVLFLPMAAKINRAGFNVQVSVSQDEIQRSNMTDAVKKRMSTQICLCYAEYLTGGNRMFLCYPSTLQRIIAKYKNDPFFKKAALLSITYYKVNNPELRMEFSLTKGDSIRGYNYSYDEWFALLNQYGLENETPEIEFFNNPEEDFFNQEDVMNEQKRKIIRLTENDIHRIVFETINNLTQQNKSIVLQPIDGGNAETQPITRTSGVIAIV